MGEHVDMVAGSIIFGCAALYSGKQLLPLAVYPDMEQLLWTECSHMLQSVVLTWMFMFVNLECNGHCYK